MRFSFILSILGQQFAVASSPDEDEELLDVPPVSSDTELFGFAGGRPEEEYEEEITHA